MTHKQLHARLADQARFSFLASAWRNALGQLALFADEYKLKFKQRIGDDYVIGPYWADTMRSLHRLLDCDMGQAIDCAAASACINDMLKLEGFEL